MINNSLFIFSNVHYRMGWLVCTRYLQLELETEKNKNSTYSTSGQEIFSNFVGTEHAAYTPVTLILLRGILDFSIPQFANNADWMVPILSQLILCTDHNIRLCVSNIYIKHINNTILVALKEQLIRTYVLVQYVERTYVQ